MLIFCSRGHGETPQRALPPLQMRHSSLDIGRIFCIALWMHCPLDLTTRSLWIECLTMHLNSTFLDNLFSPARAEEHLEGASCPGLSVPSNPNLQFFFFPLFCLPYETPYLRLSFSSCFLPSFHPEMF